jgi:hypothetical protein
LVDFFFVLSGFVMNLNYADRLRDVSDLARFQFLRLGRIPEQLLLIDHRGGLQQTRLHQARVARKVLELCRAGFLFHLHALRNLSLWAGVCGTQSRWPALSA